MKALFLKSSHAPESAAQQKKKLPNLERKYMRRIPRFSSEPDCPNKICFLLFLFYTIVIHAMRNSRAVCWPSSTISASTFPLVFLFQNLFKTKHETEPAFGHPRFNFLYASKQGDEFWKNCAEQISAVQRNKNIELAAPGNHPTHNQSQNDIPGSSQKESAKL